MADTTYALIQSYLPDIWETALWYLQQETIAPALVQVFTGRMGDEPRKGTKYSAGHRRIADRRHRSSATAQTFSSCPVRHLDAWGSGNDVQA
jgi:hypothetical protein